MITEVTHTEKWVLRIVREESDTRMGFGKWPSRILLNGRKTSWFRPTEIRVIIVARDTLPLHVTVEGDRLASESPGKVENRYLLRDAPEWVQEMVQQAREQTHLGPGTTGVDWQ